MLRAAPHLAGFLLPVIIVASVLRGGGAWTFLPLAILVVALPIIDWLAGLNLENPGEDQSLDRNPWFRAITWLWVPVHIALVVWAVRVAPGLTVVEAAGLIISLGLTAGTVGITFAHELVHRPGAFERGLGEILLTVTSYPHFAIEHVYGHHRYVGTPRDPATARFGESIYAFVPRCVAGSIRSAWGHECQRLAKRGRGCWHPSNRMLRYAAVQVVMYGAAAALYGWRGALFLGAQAVVAFSLLEIINYVEHYGLMRRELSPGRYERVMPWHSWNSSHRVSNWLLINLARHSDHHLVAAKRYQSLDHLDAAPQLPAGYAAMFLLALCPPLWRRVMHPRVNAWRQQHYAQNV